MSATGSTDPTVANDAQDRPTGEHHQRGGLERPDRVRERVDDEPSGPDVPCGIDTEQSDEGEGGCDDWKDPSTACGRAVRQSDRPGDDRDRGPGSGEAQPQWSGETAGIRRGSDGDEIPGACGARRIGRPEDRRHDADHADAHEVSREDRRLRAAPQDRRPVAQARVRHDRRAGGPEDETDGEQDRAPRAGTDPPGGEPRQCRAHGEPPESLPWVGDQGDAAGGGQEHTRGQADRDRQWGAGTRPDRGLARREPRGTEADRNDRREQAEDARCAQAGQHPGHRATRATARGGIGVTPIPDQCRPLARPREVSGAT